MASAREMMAERCADSQKNCHPWEQPVNDSLPRLAPEREGSTLCRHSTRRMNFKALATPDFPESRWSVWITHISSSSQKRSGCALSSRKLNILNHWFSSLLNVRPKVRGLDDRRLPDYALRGNARDGRTAIV